MVAVIEAFGLDLGVLNVGSSDINGSNVAIRMEGWVVVRGVANERLDSFGEVLHKFVSENVFRDLKVVVNGGRDSSESSVSA